jgi:phosphosulfolactate synthase
LRGPALGFTAIKLSDGTITLSGQARADAIKRARDANLKVFSEVGKKAPALALPVAQLCEQIAADLALGVAKVIVEARESGTGIGIYDAGGTVRQEMLAAILAALGDHADDVIWEAPRQSQQAQLIQRCGANVNLGNVRPRDVLGLEESLNIWTRTRSWSRGRRSAAPRASRSSPCWPMGRPSSRPTGFGSRSNSAAWTQRSAH